jgi:predicted nucleic acid-binding protein
MGGQSDVARAGKNRPPGNAARQKIPVKILLDCDVLLDVMAGRKKFMADSARVFDACEAGEIQGAIAWHTLANAYYLAEDRRNALKFLEDLLSFVEVVSGDTELALKAIRAGFSDFEDALQSACAGKFEAGFIVTRNVKDYKLSAIKAISPPDFIGKFLDA